MPSRRWKLATLVFATATAMLVLREPPAPAAAKRPTYKGPVTPTIALRRSTGPTRRLGVDEATLIAELRAERDPRRAVLLINKLGIVGSDVAVEALIDFADDRRPSVASTALYAIGQIGTDTAVDFLLAFEASGVPKLRGDTISALGETLHDQARVRLLAIANDPADRLRGDALDELNNFEHEDVVKTLSTIATTAEYWTARSALYELGEMTIPSARTALLTALHSTDSRIVALAIESIPDLPSVELYELLEDGDVTVATAAASALGRSGDLDALVALERTARTGAEGARTAAVAAIAELGGTDAQALLAGLLVAGNKATVRAAAEALVASGEDEARELLLATARKPGLARMEILQAIKGMRGDDVEDLMLDVGRTGTRDERELAFQSLIETGSARGFALAVSAAKAGTEGSYVIAMIAGGPAREARRALEDLARTSHGTTRLAALDYLAELGIDASTQTMLSDLLRSGDNDTRRQAANVLAKSGSRGAREALYAAISGSNRQATEAAVDVLLDVDGSPAARESIVRAARTTPALREKAIDALLAHGAPEGLALARDALAGDDASLAGDAATALGRSDDSSATDILLASAASSKPSARIAAAKALAERGDARSRDALARLAKDASPEVRAEAFDGLAELGSTESIATLGRIAADGDVEDRKQAIDALGRTRSDLGHEALASVLTTERDPSVLLEAIREASSGGDVLVDALHTVMLDPDAASDVRVAAAEQLESSGALAETDRHYLTPPPPPAEESEDNEPSD